MDYQPGLNVHADGLNLALHALEPNDDRLGENIITAQPDGDLLPLLCTVTGMLAATLASAPADMRAHLIGHFRLIAESVPGPGLLDQAKYPYSARQDTGRERLKEGLLMMISTTQAAGIADRAIGIAHRTVAAMHAGDITASEAVLLLACQLEAIARNARQLANVADPAVVC